MVDKIIDVPMSLKEVNIGLLVNRIIELDYINKNKLYKHTAYFIYNIP